MSEVLAIDTQSKQVVTQPAWASEVGEDEYGHYADLDFKGVVQRFRWIKSGKFLMGSPDNEQDRSSDETQHEVILTKGYWLAETACTQALWQAVMGNNLSCFKGDELPVDCVSWEDVQSFVEKVNGLGGDKTLDFRLPTEAEWEYGCRARTDTPFSFGETINSKQVNFNGNFPYLNSKKSEYREKTIVVHSLLCNNWGLYEMHGNLWEWCEDWHRCYEASNKITVDPRSHDTGRGRVMRGGAWVSVAGGCRSACRFIVAPNVCDAYTDFCLASGHQVTESG